MRMPIEKIIKKIMDNINLYKRTEGDFRIHRELYETIWTFLEGLKESNNKKTRRIPRKLEEKKHKRKNKTIQNAPIRNPRILINNL
ncbi:MAG: hypothetical protein Q6363_004615 [Candidatus Njordarchaeota archaeon]